MTVPAELYPLLVTFDDIADPTTARRVDPSDLASMFGPGYALKAITLEITDEKVSAGRVEAVLGWLVKAPYIVPPDPTGRYGEKKIFGQTIMPRDFIDWRSLKKKREGVG